MESKTKLFLFLFGDHGESLTEHDVYWDHCGLYDTTVHVPVIMRWPGHIPQGRRVKRAHSTGRFISNHLRSY
ncbi:hypothetical protein GCM10020331_060810 [Ectobacillus funiculus]